MLKMLVAVNKACHVPHTSRITSQRRIFIITFLVSPMKRVRSWSLASWVTNDKMSLKKLLIVRPKTVTRRKRRRKNYTGNWKASSVTRKHGKFEFLVFIEGKHLLQKKEKENKKSCFSNPTRAYITFRKIFWNYYSMFHSKSVQHNQKQSYLMWQNKNVFDLQDPHELP